MRFEDALKQYEAEMAKKPIPAYLKQFSPPAEDKTGRGITYRDPTGNIASGRADRGRAKK